MEIKFKIVEVDEIKKINNDNYIRVEVFNNNKSIGEFWQDLKTLEKNMNKVGEDAYINLSDYKDAI